ncbi:hypothetical protein D7D25_11070 [Proteiniphilum sp. X52]|nr:hypothetical protein D7D25_11070 [Proteiniphilum sp. X52]
MNYFVNFSFGYFAVTKQKSIFALQFQRETWLVVVEHHLAPKENETNLGKECLQSGLVEHVEYYCGSSSVGRASPCPKRKMKLTLARSACRVIG